MSQNQSCTLPITASPLSCSLFSSHLCKILLAEPWVPTTMLEAEQPYCSKDGKVPAGLACLGWATLSCMGSSPLDQQGS